MFNIETYLDSLPEDIEQIDVSDKGIGYLPNLQRFKKVENISLHKICINKILRELREKIIINNMNDNEIKKELINMF